MDMKQLTTFLALAEQKNYLKTAERLNYAPSTLAKHIHLLETEMGTRLVEHRDNRIELTPDGGRFLLYARQMLHTYWDAEEAFSGTAELSDAIRVAGGEPIVGYSLSDFFLRYCTEHKKVYLNVQMVCCARVPDWLRRKEIDLGFLHEMTLDVGDAYEAVPLYGECICLVARREHPLCRQAAVLPPDLAGQSFAFTYEDCCFTAEFRRRMKAAGIAPESELFLGSLSAILSCVRQDGRIALIPHSSLPKVLATGGLCVLPWRGAPLRAWMEILYSKSHCLTPSEKVLIRQAKDHAAALLAGDKDGVYTAPTV